MAGSGAIIGIAVGSVIVGVVILVFLTHFLRMWLRGPSSGSDSRKRLDGKVVAITGKRKFVFKKSQQVVKYDRDGMGLEFFDPLGYG